MKEITIRLPDEYKPKLKTLAEQRGLRPAEFARLKLMEALDREVRSRHRAAMEELVQQAIDNQELRDDSLEKASLEALSKQSV